MNADVEIDFDIPVISFDSLDDVANRALAAEFTTNLAAVLASADAAGRSVAIFHWTTAETGRARAFPELHELLDGRTVDLYQWVRDNFRVRVSYSIKNVAPMVGFEGGVDEPGGCGSIDKIDQARLPGADGEAARERCLLYNESDVAAQTAIRDGIRGRSIQSLVR